MTARERYKLLMRDTDVITSCPKEIIHTLKNTSLECDDKTMKSCPIPLTRYTRNLYEQYTGLTSGHTHYMKY